MAYHPVLKVLKMINLIFFAAFLVKYLEQRSCDLDLNTKWVFLLLLDIGVSPLKLMEIYDRLFKSRVFTYIVYMLLSFSIH